MVEAAGALATRLPCRVPAVSVPGGDHLNADEMTICVSWDDSRPHT